MTRRLPAALALLVLAASGFMMLKSSPRQPRRADAAQPQVPLVTGKFISPVGQHLPVGSFPVNLRATPDGRFIVVTNSGYRQRLTVIDAASGEKASEIALDSVQSGKRQGLYYGLAFGPAANGYLLYASRGAEDRVAVYAIDRSGRIAPTGQFLSDPSKASDPRLTNLIAGIALTEYGGKLLATNNNTGPHTEMAGWLSVIDVATGKVERKIKVGGFPYDVAALTAGPSANRKAYVSSERDGVVSVVDVIAGSEIARIRTGAAPTSLLLSADQRRLYVSNSSSDTVSVIDTETDRVVQTIMLRPAEARGIPGATPLGMALSPDERRLYVALADMNAIAVADARAGRLLGYLPTGWYPTATAITRDGKTLYVSSAKGVQARNPNARPVADRGQYIQNIIEGSLTRIPVPSDNELAAHTTAVLTNNRLRNLAASTAEFVRPPVEHVIYIIKENRTYDQVLGDLPQGNGDPSLCLFPRAVTPNQHALAERFVLLDNFYCCAEVSADGWNWSTSGMANEYVARNAPYNYSGRGRVYDFEGQNNGVSVDLRGLTDVARAPGGYIWENCLRSGVSFRNYGFFARFDDPEVRQKPDPKTGEAGNLPTKRALVGRTDTNFRMYDNGYADSDAWVIYNLPHKNQLLKYGKFDAPSRFSAWKREFDAYVRNRNLPKFLMVRFGNNHTVGTRVDWPTPRAMVADNDYAVGQLVEAVSKSPYWKKTAIFIVEDDAQNGHDHVDAHRSIAFVISPYIRKGTVDSRFYNTDSALRTMELILGMPPMCQYDAVAPPYAFFSREPVNSEPYEAILPAREILAERNRSNAYASKLSERLNWKEADAVPDDVLTRIIWHALKGADVPAPPIKRAGPLVVRHDRDD